jgi:hypothetical protein
MEQAGPGGIAAVVARIERGFERFGGIVPCSATARDAETVVTALALEHHSDGAALPLLALSDAPGVLDWDPEEGLEVADDTGRLYDARGVSVQPALGAMAATLWLEPAVPPDATRLSVEVAGLVRRGPARAGRPVERPITGGPWRLEIDLTPSRTAAPIPPYPVDARPEPSAARVPARSFRAFTGVLPIGQARITSHGAGCVWAMERYEDRGVMTVAGLLADRAPGARLRFGPGAIEVWDDRGGRYSALPVHGSSGRGWVEAAIEVTPGIDPAARTLGVRISEVPELADRGELQFGIAVPQDA